jgi:hypothetical protein
MRRFFWFALAVVAPLGLVGCGSSSEQSVAEQSAGDKPAQTTADTKGPDVAVFDFLKAVQTGNDEGAANMLTKLARQKTEEMEMVVAPPGSETASFEVGQVEMIQDHGAYVSSTWTDQDEEGKPHSDQIVWVLRREPEGWRIAGMVTKLFDNKLVLNFEDPEDMMRKQQLAEQEMIKRSQQQLQGQPPADGQAVASEQSPAAGQPSATQAQQPAAGQPLR